MMRSVSETFSTGTANVVYATKAGRKIQDSQRRAAASVGILFAVCDMGRDITDSMCFVPLGESLENAHWKL